MLRRKLCVLSWSAESRPPSDGMRRAPDVGLLGMMLKAEQERIPPDEGEQRLNGDDLYASPFPSMPF